MEAKKYNCLVVDDEPIARRLLKEYIEETDFLELVGAAENPLKATALINDLTIDLIFLDINLPKVDGTEILSMIKNDALLKVIPVIMLTTSDAERDIMQAYYNHANCYITKPVDMDKFMEIIQTIKNFWISIVKLPKTNE